MSENKGAAQHEEMLELRRGPWTLEEDTLLIHYIACHGEGRWNLLARCSGLKRTGKSCRLRWLNYLKPDVKRGNLSPEEQLMILDLHSKWGNRWSRIAQHLPGRTDNEIKNYWRTRVQKQARQLKIDANSAVFRDAVRCYWMPRLLEKMASSSASQSLNSLHPNTTATTVLDHHHHHHHQASFPPPVDSRMQGSIHSSRCDERSGSDNCGSSVSSGTTAVAQLPNLSELPWSHGGELGRVPFNPFLGGTYDIVDASGSDSGPASGYLASDCATAGNDFVDDDIADTLWGIVESYMNGLNGDDTC